MDDTQKNSNVLLHPARKSPRRRWASTLQLLTVPRWMPEHTVKREDVILRTCILYRVLK